MSTAQAATIKPDPIKEFYHGDLIQEFCDRLTKWGIVVFKMLESNIHAGDENTEHRGQTMWCGEVFVEWLHCVEQMGGRLNELAGRISGQLHEGKSERRALFCKIQGTISDVYWESVWMLSVRQ